MADNGGDSHAGNTNSTAPGQAMHPRAPGRFAVTFGQWLDRSDAIVYSLTGLCFLLLALFTLGYSLWDFFVALSNLPSLAAGQQSAFVFSAIAELTADLLLVLVIAEILGTVIHFLKDHVTSMRPYFFIGIISSIRVILSLGAKLLLLKQSEGPEFSASMIELGVTTATVFVLGFTLWLFETRIDNGVNQMERPDRY